MQYGQATLPTLQYIELEMVDEVLPSYTCYTSRCQFPEGRKLDSHQENRKEV